MRRKSDRGGMTILEITIVVSIMGIVAAILAFAISAIREKVRIEQAQQDLQRLSSAIEQLAFDTGTWPGGLQRTTQDREVWDLSQPQSGLLTNNGVFGSGWKGPYLDSIPTDPWGMKYFFDSDYTKGSSIISVVGSFGPNKVGQNVYDSDNIIIEITRR